ncbi:hypothetical protein SteCoe_4029 [Stentor coeruleus]|uniref:Protein kinase domain-containing protein n=1 Tax=Stentor coeruleus TaxID=5963 RepID=A0A1R2CVS9_9CILI|nr:hypothetical protein SteCoe_4029 [Stentor coeruleus]
MGNQFTQQSSLSSLIENQDLMAAVKLLQNGANPNELNQKGKSCLRLALEQGNSQIYRILHQISGEIIPPLVNETPLHHAVRHNHTKLVRMFLRNPTAFPNYKNAKNSEGQTSLHIAAMLGYSEIVALLLKYNAQADSKDKYGKTPRDLAIESDSPQLNEILELLGSEELIVRTPNPGKEVKESPHMRRISSKSTHFSSQIDSENNLLALEVALKDSLIPLIPSEEVKFCEIINRGSSCVVYKGMWRGTDIAIKQFKIEYSTSAKELEKFIKEMQILSKIRHPNLILLMGVCIDQPNLCLLSELVQNCSLFQAIHKSQKPLTIENRFKIAIQITQGLVYLHSNNPPIIHRDLKPENCLLDESFNIKIADFGLARPLTRFIGEEIQTTVCIGTTRFMAPELFDKSKSKSIGVGVDIWALGCIFIEVFSGKRPWSHISTADVNCIYYELFNKKPIPIPTCIPEPVRKIISKCCDYFPLNRPTASNILHELISIKSQFM